MVQFKQPANQEPIDTHMYMIDMYTHTLASLSTKRAIRVRALLDPLVLERWNSITVLLTSPTSADDWLKKGSPCVIMSV